MTTTHLTHETPHKSMNAGNGVSHLHRLHSRHYKDSLQKSKPAFKETGFAFSEW